MEREEKFKAHRLLHIEKLIRSGTFPSVEKLVSEFGVSRRTNLRDIEFLRDRYNAPVEYDNARKGYFYTDPTFMIRNVLMTEGDLFTISTIMPLLEQYKNTPLENSFRSIMEKIAEILPEQVSVDSSFLNKDISFISDPLPKIDESVFLEIFKAVKIFSVLEFEYKSSGSKEFKRKVFDPYHVVCQKGNWYVMGHDHEADEVRIYALSRIKNIRQTDKHFSVTADFDMNRHIDLSFGVWNNPEEPEEFSLIFNANLEGYITEREWHKNQIVERTADGKIRLIFKTNQKQIVQSWVMGFGTSVRVENPRWLQDRIREEAKKIVTMYS